MTEQEIINAINTVQGIERMTANERLFVCGLMDEYDKAKITTKSRLKGN